MRRWQIISISVVAAVALLCIGGFVFYRYYLVPEYLEPVMEKVRDCVNEDEVLDTLYDQAVRFHDDGIMDDGVYDRFVDTYEKRTRDNESFAREILEAKEKDENDSTTEPTSVSAKYASTKVGVETIQTNDGESGGKSTKRYSEERSSARIKAEDVVEAEKVIYEIENSTEQPENEEEKAKTSAYAILKANMTADEFNSFLSIMGKLDTGVLASYADKNSKSLYDKEGLKEYLHSRLSNDEYKKIVNMGYKYLYLFMED